MSSSKLNTEKELVLPNFFIIGVAKSGTTSLARFIQRNSEIFVAPVKETDFFSWDVEYKKGIAYYSDAHFSGVHHQAIGDASGSYFTSEIARDRIARDIPASSHRFIVILRDPVKRAYSQYLMARFRHRTEKLSFEDAVLEDRERRSVLANGRFPTSYLWPSEYGTLIGSWKAKFPEGKFLFLQSDQFRDEPSVTFESVVKFLGIESKLMESEDGFEMLDSPQVNGASATLFGLTGRTTRVPPRALNVVRKFTSYTFRSTVLRKMDRFDRFLERRLSSYKDSRQLPQMEKELEYELRRRFESEVKLAARITGLDLSAWLPSD